MKAWVKALMRAFFPRRCIYCSRVIPPEMTACRECAKTLPRMELPVCYRCGRTKKLCICKGHRRHFDRCVAAMRYEDGVSVAVNVLKKTRNADYVETMAEEMVAVARERIDASAFDVVTFVPMRKGEYRRRGYNQSELLARETASILGVPCRELLVKRYDTRPQKSLKANERPGNVLGVYDALEDLTEQRVLLIDDVITTGSTLHECAKMLKLRGAVSVTALVFAAAIPKENEDTDV